jgi:hypothetical protein
VADRDHPPILFLILLAVGAWLLWRYLSSRETPEQRARRLEEEARARREAEEERVGILGRAVPPDIQRDMRAFLKAGNFSGEEQSPLAYVGYKVGKTHGLPPWDRQRRLTVCFQTEIPRQLAAQYQAWGRPATHRRFVSMCQHLRMLANTRRHRANYEHAVADWETDETWFRSEFGSVADRLRQHGFQA